MESGLVDEVFGQPLHPYTQGLLQCVPRLDLAKEEELTTIVGTPPNLIELPSYCPFYPRCFASEEYCRQHAVPELDYFGGEHYAACHVLSGGELNEAIS
ncbi:MAG TPA: hypothetical protein GX699_10635 [Firmicutes bacterium]|nr:hypothetical protein [Bacillota bacterium]